MNNNIYEQYDNISEVDSIPFEPEMNFKTIEQFIAYEATRF